MIKVFYNGDLEGVLRPTPFVSIQKQCLYNKKGQFGVLYNITLTGKLLECEGYPYALKPGTEDLEDFFGSPTVARIGPYGQFDSTPFSSRQRPPRQKSMQPAVALFSKQRALRALFEKEGLVLSINGIFDNTDAEIWFQPRVESISFSEGQYINTCDYTISMQASRLHRGAVSQGNWETGQDQEGQPSGMLHNVEDVDIESFTEDWTLEVEDQLAEATRPQDPVRFPRTYRVSHNISAVGQKRMNLDGTVYMHAWEAARKFCQEYLLTKNRGGIKFGGQDANAILENSARAAAFPGYPNSGEIGGLNSIGFFGINLQSDPSFGDLRETQDPTYNQTPDFNQYNSYNHSRNETIDEAGGTYSLNDTFVLATKPVLEEFNTSVSLSTSDPFTTVTIDGTITGLTSLRSDQYGTGLPVDTPTPLDYWEGGQPPVEVSEPGGGSPTLWGFQRNQTKYGNAKEWFDIISDNGTVAQQKQRATSQAALIASYKSDIYRRAAQNVPDFLNPQPLSMSVAHDEIRGVITYSYQYNNRPMNWIAGTKSESVQINDTYPGDVFATIGVPGRATGPVLQWQGGRTEYKRDVSISLIMSDYTQGYDWENRLLEGYDYELQETLNLRNPWLLTKPSVREPQKTQLAELIYALSPANEPGVRKWFVQPPTENWTPKDGSYTLNISWVYELDV